MEIVLMNDSIVSWFNKKKVNTGICIYLPENSYVFIKDY